MKTRIAAFCAIALAAALGGCVLVTPGDTGSLSISVQPFAPWLAGEKAVGSGGDGAARAWMVASSVRFDLYLGTSIAQSWTWTPAGPSPGSATAVGTTTRSGIPAGSYTKLAVSIYNADVSSTTPTVYGESSALTITTGLTTSTTVTCFPPSPITLSEGFYSSTYSLARTSWGGEKWFVVDTPYTTTRFYVDSLSGDMDLYVFGPDGSYIGRVFDSATESYVDLATPSNPYYVCMYAYSAGSGRVKWTSVGAGTLSITVK